MSYADVPAMDAQACSRCGACDRTSTTVMLEVAHGSIAVLAEGLAVTRCACGHDEVPGHVGTTLAESVAARLPIANPRRLRSDVCVACARPLTMPVRRTVRAVTATPSGTPVTTLRFDLPMQRCSECGLDQLPSRAHEDLAELLARLPDRAVETLEGPSRP